MEKLVVESHGTPNSPNGQNQISWTVHTIPNFPVSNHETIETFTATSEDFGNENVIYRYFTELFI